MASTEAPARPGRWSQRQKRDPGVTEVSRASAWARWARMGFLVPAVLYVLFAFAIYDSHERSIFLARDPFAIHGAARFDVVEVSATKTAPGLDALKAL